MVAGDRELRVSIEFKWADADQAKAAADQAVRTAISTTVDENETPDTGWDKGTTGRLPN
jgi:hypothetical protein